MDKDLTSAKAVRAIAIFETAKGILGFVVGIALLSLLHRDLRKAAENFLSYLHVDPAGNFAQAFVERAAQINESNITLFVVLAFVYALVRFVEAYGLWRLRPWAEWFAIIAGAIYLPFEIYEIFQKPTIIKFAILFFNLALVLYLIDVRRKANRHKIQEQAETL